ncbi:hypothetical protein A7A08_02546 [Methyloligella halotolerans]|uniref:Porin domain-containing protein n=1 Tax=Methyloligella halotolerans TaxID=1177755 RepID=A0A1E2RXF2_9HYPH|nr:porin [Methyloligella halotolerans]ODA66778.1 hypothetical protein A7A08_02546 [Methyloligella halotolerans]
MSIWMKERAWPGLRDLLCVVAAGTILAHAAPARAENLNATADCCADLEQRVADLEATTVRRGNRKVSIRVYGIMNRAANFWDDGGSSSMDVVNNYYVNSRFGFVGEAAINPNWKVGYRAEVGMNDALSSLVDQYGANTGDPVVIRESHLILSGENVGTFRMGLTSTAADNVTWLAQPVKLANFAYAQDLAFNRDFYLRTKGTQGATGLSDITFGDVARCYSLGDAFDCSNRRNGISYWTPEFGGFQVGADWAEDTWALGAIYKSVWADTFQVIAAAGYENIQNENIGAYYGGSHEIQQSGGSASVMHTPTGLYVYGSVTSSQIDDPVTKNAGIYTHSSMPDMNGFDIQGGLHRQFLDIGPSTFFGGFNRISDGVAGASPDANRSLAPGTFYNLDIPTEITGSQMDRFYLGYDQSIIEDTVHLYVVYQHYEPEVDLVDSSRSAVSAPLDDFHLLYAGGYVFF